MSEKEDGRVEFAARDALRFLGDVERVFLTFVLDSPGAWISDLSSLSDFRPDNDRSLAERPGSTPGSFVFRRARPLRSPPSPLSEAGREALAAHVWEYDEVEEAGVDWNAAILRRARLWYGVDMTPVLGATLPEIFLHLATSMSPERRRAIAADGRLGRRLEFFLAHPKRHDSTYWWSTPTHEVKVLMLEGGEATVYEAEGAPDEVDGGGGGRGPWTLLTRLQTEGDREGRVLDARRMVNELLRRVGRLPLRRLRDGRE